MKLNKTTILALLSLVILGFSTLKSDDGVSVNVGADVMNRYIFRGTDYGNSPSIQPTFSISTGGFEIGYWGAISLTSYYQEIDLYAKYTIGGLSIIFTDYYIPYITSDPASSDIRYFVFDDKKTAHTFEGALAYDFGEGFPLKIYASAFFYGNDKRWGYDEEKDKDEKTYFSTYLELGYPLISGNNNLDLFVGMTPSAGAFGNTMGVINLGFTGSKKVKMTNDFELPVKSSVVYNPQLSLVYFVFGITL